VQSARPTLEEIDMPTIRPIDVAHATGDTANALAGVKAKLGTVPNLFTTLAHAPGALHFYLQGADALGRGSFTARQRELIALAVADANGCGYCLAAHTAIGGMVGLEADEMVAAQDGRSANPRDAALVALARRIVATRANLDAGDLSAARSAGLAHADILETIAVVALNIFTNYVNHIAGTEVDFPAVPVRNAA
jgi:uncharacterized peroxidase-related enzyme